MSDLAVNTLRGLATLADEDHAAERYENATGLKYIRTPKNMPARVDAVMVRGIEIQSVVETKCRYDYTFDELKAKYGGEFMVQQDKLESLAQASELFCVPGVLLIYLLKDQSVLVQPFTNAKGEWMIPTHCRRGRGQDTINGGMIERSYAYVDVRKATEI